MEELNLKNIVMLLLFRSFAYQPIIPQVSIVVSKVLKTELKVPITFLKVPITVFIDNFIENINKKKV